MGMGMLIVGQPAYRRTVVFMSVTVCVGVRMLLIPLMQMLMGVLRLIRELSIHQHIDFRRSDATAINTVDSEFGAYIQRSYGPLQKFLTDAGLKQGAKHHVSTNSRKALEVGYTHIFT